MEKIVSLEKALIAAYMAGNAYDRCLAVSELKKEFFHCNWDARIDISIHTVVTNQAIEQEMNNG